MEFKVKESAVIKIVFGGSTYTVSRPKMGQALDLEDKIEAAQAAGKGGTRLVMDFITGCGLPAEVVRELDPEQLEEIVGALMPSKKK